LKAIESREAADNLSDSIDLTVASTMFADVEPPHAYVRDASASVVHHRDYLDRRDDHALCGAALVDATALTETGSADAMCPDCEAQLVAYHLDWWRGRAQVATAELEELRVKYRELEEYADTQRRQPAPTRLGENPSDETSDSRRHGERESQGAFASEQAEAMPKTLLDYARRELAELCRQFDGDLPYFRLKHTMQAFSDKLETHERVLLAQEIGADGSLIRWSTTEVEARGWRVLNNPVQRDSEGMWDDWVQDSYQPPKKTKRRLGWSRSHDGS
jgi:hypothetical protein